MSWPFRAKPSKPADTSATQPPSEGGSGATRSSTENLSQPQPQPQPQPQQHAPEAPASPQLVLTHSAGLGIAPDRDQGRASGTPVSTGSRTARAAPLASSNLVAASQSATPVSAEAPSAAGNAAPALEDLDHDEAAQGSSRSQPPLSIPRRQRPPQSVRAQPSSRNRVLPSYEEELQADNTVVRESNPRWMYRRALHMVNGWFHYLMGRDAESRAAGPLSSAVDRLTRTPFDIERVAVIGVHGWFPSRLLQRVVGEPIGTSTHFARKLALACQHFFYDRYGISLPMDAMTIIPLEGEGKVEDRVDLLYNQLVNPSRKWSSAVRDADLVLVSAHSQGTPVATMLVARLIENGLLDPRKQRTGILAMAGISHGPYPHLKSSVIVKYVESDPARQLFDFNDPTSAIAQTYYAAIHKVLSAGARFIAVGSWYDQVVPLYSATLHGVNHPNIYRALYIDAADYQPDFLSHLVVFALKLRNAGLSDHGLIVHLSDVLAGNIYGFGTQGHYAIYEEENTYKVAVAWTMGSRPPWTLAHMTASGTQTPSTSTTETGSTATQSAQGRPQAVALAEDQHANTRAHDAILTRPAFQAPQRNNPYYLPWIMAKLVTDPHIAANPKLTQDLADLVRLFDVWDVGSSRTLKDIKYRLEPLKAKL
ncbi:hypothetical protein HK105_206910 [Polyrhizophydium stewartii]|uniref:YMC020W-like alpha/beta hydrolase domain-containing protein n=1 Tax=Polyrhizophydium stewartii TaxID=2732419 RepID=A0ABR4N2A0_9FUNG